MKETSVDIGKVYALRSQTGGQVTDENGNILETLEPNVQLRTMAQEQKWLVPDDCKVTKGNFKRALAALFLLGEGNAWLAALKKELSAILDGANISYRYSSAKRHLMILTDLSDDSLNSVVDEACSRVVPSGITYEVLNLNKYAHCETTAAMAAVNPDWRNDLTREGEWLWNLTSLKEYGVFAGNEKITVFNADLCDGYHSVYRMFYGCTSLREVHGDFSNFRSAMEMCDGCVNLSVFTPVMPLLPTHMNGPDWVFKGCILNKKSVLSFLGALPAATRSLGMGIHVDYQTDDEVLAAIEEMEAKGWTMMIQWNGTPTAKAATTYRLRRTATLPVYAKQSTMECPDGSIESVFDWCHYVTNWEENGYMEFASLDEAKEHFNITE